MRTRGVIGFCGFLLISVLLTISIICNSISGQLSGWELVRALLLVGYYMLASIAYIIRYPKVYQGRGFKEGVFPFIVAFALPLLIALSSDKEIAGTVLPGGPGLLAKDITLYPLKVLGAVIGISGIVLTIWALWHLRRSFAIAVSFSKLVKSGPYRWINHPMYCGEFMNLLGYWLGMTTPLGGIFLFVFGFGLISRASLENRCLSRIGFD